LGGARSGRDLNCQSARMGEESARAVRKVLMMEDMLDNSIISLESKVLF
jgi:hypothetical protein